jgi:hypothetical protein
VVRQKQSSRRHLKHVSRLASLFLGTVRRSCQTCMQETIDFSPIVSRNKPVAPEGGKFGDRNRGICVAIYRTSLPKPRSQRTVRRVYA